MEPPNASLTYQGSLSPPWAAGPAQTVPAVARVKLGALLNFVLIALVTGVLAGILGALMDGEAGLFVGLMFFGMFILLGSYVALTMRQAPCPYCQGVLGGTFRSGLTPRDENQQLECPHCFEWLVSHKGTVRALRDEDVLIAFLYTCPVFQHGAWPDECITCGAAVVRREEAKTPGGETLELPASAAADSASVVKGVPYCQAHERQVFLHRNDRGGLLVVFSDYGARRRYLAANARRVPVMLPKA